MNFNGSLVREAKFVPISVPKDYSSAASTTEYVSMKAYNKITFVIYTGAWAAGTAAVTVKQATDVSNSLSDEKAVTFTRMWTGTTDALTETAVTSSTFNLAAASTLYVVEVNDAMLDVNGGFDCVSLQVASPGANADLYSIVAICQGGRYTTTPSSIVD